MTCFLCCCVRIQTAIAAQLSSAVNIVSWEFQPLTKVSWFITRMIIIVITFCVINAIWWYYGRLWFLLRPPDDPHPSHETILLYRLLTNCSDLPRSQDIPYAQISISSLVCWCWQSALLDSVSMASKSATMKSLASPLFCRRWTWVLMTLWMNKLPADPLHGQHIHFRPARTVF